MKNVSENLLALQNLELGPASPEADRQIEALRAKIPESLLIQFDRWRARGRKAVAVVRKGVCCECHIGVAIGILGALTFGEEIQRCGNCGRFLYLPENEPVIPPGPAPQTKAAPRRRKKASHAS